MTNTEQQTAIRQLIAFFRNEYPRICRIVRIDQRANVTPDHHRPYINAYAILERAIGKCTKREQQLIKYRYQQQLKTYEIADVMHISKTTYFVIHRQCLKTIADVLKHEVPELWTDIIKYG